jgi:hypothetical protein
LKAEWHVLNSLSEGDNMRIFAIRKQNGETTIISAKNQEEAIKAAGLTMETVLDVVDQLRRQGHEIASTDLMKDGIGPQP